MVILQLLGLFIAFLVVLIPGVQAMPDPKTTLVSVEDEDGTLGSWKPRGSRRVIYASDLSNTTSQMSESGAKPEELRQIVRNYAHEGGIDTLVQEVWHQGWSEFWRTDKCPYDSRFQHQRLVPMMDAGVMPIEVYIDECHKQKMEFIAGFRMNDRHGHNPDLFERISREHPEWILTEFQPTSRSSDPRSYKVGCALDYSQKGVRDWLFSIMQEVANRFDVDGIEFNFTRMPECFPSDKAEQSHAIMSSFVRRVRAMLNKASEKKGRKLLFGVRVLQNIEGCKKMGLDVPTWIKERLVNYVVPGDIGFTEFNAKYEEFVRIARANDCYVYPQIEAKLGLNHRKPLQSVDQYRAVLQNLYGAGADGFSTQNYFHHWGPKFSPGETGFKFPEMYLKALNTLKELRDPKMLPTGDRHYVFVPLWGPVVSSSVYGGRGPGGTYKPEQIVLNRNKISERFEFRFRICENLPADSRISGQEVVSGAVLIFKPGIVLGDEISIDINGKIIPPENISYEWSKEKNRPLVRFALSSPPAVYGDNYLGMELVKSASGEERDIVMNEVEVIVVSNKSTVSSNSVLGRDGIAFP